MLYFVILLNVVLVVSGLTTYIDGYGCCEKCKQEQRITCCSFWSPCSCKLLTLIFTHDYKMIFFGGEVCMHIGHPLLGWQQLILIKFWYLRFCFCFHWNHVSCVSSHTLVMLIHRQAHMTRDLIILITWLSYVSLGSASNWDHVATD